LVFYQRWGVNTELIPYSRGTQIFITSRSHHKILDIRSVMYSKFHTEDTQTEGATVHSRRDGDTAPGIWAPLPYSVVR